MRETRFEDEGVQVFESSLAIESFNIDAEVLGISLVKPQSLSGRGLMSYVAYLKRNSLDARRYETELWYRICIRVTAYGWCRRTADDRCCDRFVLLPGK